MSRSNQEQPNGKKETIILQNASVSKHKNQMQKSSDLMIPSPKRSTTESNESKDESKHYNLIRLEKRRFTLPINTHIMNSTIFIFICKYQQEGRQKFITTKRFMTATMVSGRQLGRQSSLISSDLSSSKHFCHAAICAQVHSVLDGKHHLVEQVVGITLPASLKGWQAISVFSV